VKATSKPTWGKEPGKRQAYFEGTVRVDGQVEGEIAAQDTLIVGERGRHGANQRHDDRHSRQSYWRPTRANA
jgi:hypothetical protein